MLRAIDYNKKDIKSNSRDFIKNFDNTNTYIVMTRCSEIDITIDIKVGLLKAYYKSVIKASIRSLRSRSFISSRSSDFLILNS